MGSKVTRNPLSVIRRVVWAAVAVTRRLTGLSALQIAAALFVTGAAFTAGEVVAAATSVFGWTDTHVLYAPLAVGALVYIPLRYSFDMERAQRRSRRTGSGGVVTVDPADERALLFAELSTLFMFTGLFTRISVGDTPFLQVGWVLVMAGSIATHDDRPGGHTVWAALRERFTQRVPAAVPVGG